MRRLVREEGGFALAFAMLALIVTSVMLVSVVEYTSSNARSTTRGGADQKAYSLAEAAINNAMAVLANPANNALSGSTMPGSEADAESVTWNFTSLYESGRATWWGTFDVPTSTWTLYGLGEVANPVPGQSALRRQLSATSLVVANYSQPLNATAWNYIYSMKTGDPDGCDQELVNSTIVQAPLYVMGNLCLQNTSTIQKGTDAVDVVVKGKVTLSGSSNYIGTSANKVDSVQVANGCKLGGNALHSPCGSADNVNATSVSTTPPSADPASADFDYWYNNATLGPKAPCTSSTGTPPTFDTNTVRDGNVASFQLTPAASYTCSRGSGHINWDATTRVLDVEGAIYIDGPITINNNLVNTYVGHGTIYTTKSFTISQSSELCVKLASGHCDFSGAWNPNENLIIFVADGMGLTSSILVQNSAQIQAGLYGTTKVEFENSAKAEGPVVAGEVRFENSSQIKSFPPLDTVPAGTPGNPNIYAEPQKPQNFSG